MNTGTHEAHLLPDTPFFKCRQLNVEASFDRELSHALSGGDGSYRANRYLNYGRIVGDAVSFSLSWLAQKTRTTRGDILKHLRELCALGLFSPDAIDDTYGFIYLTEEARERRFVEWTLDEHGYEVRRTDGPVYERTTPAMPPPSEPLPVKKPFADLLSDDNMAQTSTDAERPAAADKAASGKTGYDAATSFSALVRRYNDELPDKEITAALDETEHMLTVIAGTVRNMPAQNKKLHEVTARYFPQLEKLLKTYQRLYRYGRNSRKADRIRAQIIDAVHLFNHALRQLMEDLLTDAEFEISSDIRMLQMMLTRDGLLGSPFDSRQ